MIAKRKPIYTILMIGVCLIVLYKYFDKLSPVITLTDNKSRTLKYESNETLTTQKTLYGHVITRNDQGWKIDNEICLRNNKDFVLAHLINPPKTPIFVYTAQKDKWISENIIAHGQWEGDHVTLMLNYMKKFPNAVFLDLGANVGMFSISIAAHGYRVISVDCLEGNVMRLCASMKAANLKDRMTVVYNALSHTHEQFSLGTYEGNVGGTYVKKRKGSEKSVVNSIFLDDLLELYSFDQVVIKMDIETYEANALKGAYKFFDQVKIEALLMEFSAHKDKDSGKFIVDFLTSHNMEPDVPENIKRDYRKWPGREVLFLRKKSK